jgi:hypothetical protein
MISAADDATSDLYGGTVHIVGESFSKLHCVVMGITDDGKDAYDDVLNDKDIDTLEKVPNTLFLFPTLAINLYLTIILLLLSYYSFI